MNDFFKLVKLQHIFMRFAYTMPLRKKKPGQQRFLAVHVTLNFVLERFSKHDATSKTTRKWRGNSVIFPYMDVASPFSRRL